MQVEWEITLKCNYSCVYCTNLDKTIHPVLDRDVVRDFVRGLGEQYPGVEVFVFGGEPFVHPDIQWIIQCFNEFSIPFVIQTNLSAHSARVMKTITDPYLLQVSVHPTEVSVEEFMDVLSSVTATIRTIDVMFTGKEALIYYFKIKELVHPDVNVFLTPIADFGDGVSNWSTALYNKMRKDPAYQKLVRFEEVKRLGKDRSELWDDPEFSPRGKPCLYNDKYFLYGPNLELYNCCYREKHNGICNHDKCFLM